MGFLLGDLLKSLCVEIGWSYAVFWRAEEERFLMWGDGYCGFEAMDLLIKEKGLFTLVHKRMGSQVHFVGDGVVGKAALTGNHQWILQGNVDQSCLGSKDLIEINQQFLAGIQTIAVIPVIPQGVLQLGSTQLISEEIGLVNYVQNLFMQSGSMTGTHLCDASGTDLLNKFQLSANMQRSISQLGDVGNNVNAFLGKDQFSGCHDSRFSTKTSSVLTSSLNKLPVPPQQKLYDSNIRSKRMLPSTSHVVNPNSNGSLFPGYLKSLENQFRTYHGTTHGSADRHEVMVDSSKLLHLKTHESELSNSLECSESASSFGRSSSSNKAADIENSCSISGGIMGCIKSQISSNSEASQIQSLTNDLDRVLTGSCVSGGRLDHSYNQDVWYDSCLVSANEQDPNGTSSLASGQYSLVANESEVLPSSSLKTAFYQRRQHSESILFDLFDLDQASNANYSLLDDSFVSLNSEKVCELSTDASTCMRQIDPDTFGDISNEEISFSGGLFSESGSDQLLDAIVSQIKPTRKLISADNVSCKTASTETSNISLNNSSAQCNVVALSEKLPGNFVGQSTISTKSQLAGTNSFKSECSVNRSEGLCFLGDEKSKSQISLWVGKARNMNSDGMSAANCGRIDEAGKLNRKRSRTGENPRPRPKDRQMIQDRVKELREIVPNGAKMSIDALLEKTIKHMLFLESVTKHADKLKETGKPKIISEDEGLLLKDNLDGGATWAFEVGTQSVICPIIVEDLSTPRHMLVEMLCEKKGLFLEIADLIRGLGLTILKGVMEARDEKVWARFAVEANKDVTRMDVFLSLVHLLEPAAGKAALERIRHCKKPHNCFNLSPIPVTGATDCL